MPTGNVEFTILDNGGAIVNVPAASVQVVLGCATTGVNNQVVATTNPNTLAGVFTSGPLPEAAALSCLRGGTVLAIKVASNAAGYVLGTTLAPLSVSGATNVNPIVVTTSTSHGLVSGNVVTITGVGGNTAANGTFPITVLSGTTFSLPIAGSGAFTSGGSVQFQGTTFLGTGTSILTVTGTPVDDKNIQLVVVAGGTIATPGITYKLSADAGRNYGPVFALGSATTIDLAAATGVTINLAAGTLVAGDKLQFTTVAPAWNDAGVAAALVALMASPYAVTGFGPVHLTGVSAGSDFTTIESTLDSLAVGYLFTRLMGSSRDASPPKSWGGTGELETTWMTAVTADLNVTAKRCCASVGHYNMPSAFPFSQFGAPRYRRPLSWALAAREVEISPVTHAGRVSDGPLETIVVDATNDPSDGWIYHDERINPGFDVARLTSAWTRIGLGLGYFIKNPNSLAQAGSSFFLLPLGLVMDVACTLIHQIGQEEIDDDIRINDNGTIYENEALAIETTMLSELRSAMIASTPPLISNATVVVDRTTNVRATSKVTIYITIESRSYILEEDIVIGFGNALAAG